jgi:hypothetical protein
MQTLCWRAGWTAVLALSLLILLNTLPYFSLGRNFAFLVEKGSLAGQPLWRACFYTHISGGLICLITGPLLLWNGLLGRSKAAHRWIGTTYAFVVLGWAGPAGLLLSFFAKGGLAGQSCFLLLTLLWWGATARGLHLAKARRIPEHRRWMMRSYALALSAVFFRILQVGFYLAGLGDDANYVVSLWLSLVASLAVGELLVQRKGV